jgi:hypothetical protein
VGFNPHHPTRRSAADYVMVAAALAIALGLLAWAFFG